MVPARQKERPERVKRAVVEGITRWRQDRISAGIYAPAAGGNGARAETAVPAQPAAEISTALPSWITDPSGPVAAGLLPVDPAAPGVLTALPRREFMAKSIGDTTPPQMQFVEFEASWLQALGRLFVWLALIFSFTRRILWDRLRRRDTPRARAVHLRETLERAGGTFIKFGQHLAVRIDFLPWIYSTELSKMRDGMPPFPTEQAVEIIETQTGKLLPEIFAQFDPDPINSTSTACFYQALLKDGKKVIVKVRRPGIGELFMADLRVFDLLLMAVEFLTILRPGFTERMRREFRETLLAELNFTQEARSQDLFRRAAKKSGKKFFTAPRVHFDISTAEVVIEDFVSGMWLWELLAGLEKEDPTVLNLVRRLNIDPKKVARRLSWVNFWGWDENLFFHANPHPDNIIIGPNSRLIFTDFASVGAVDRTKRRALQQNMYYAWRRDSLNMARAALILLEPLPPIDLIEFTKELEGHVYQMLYVFEAEKSSAQWHERTMAIQWIGLIEVARKYQILINSDVLRLLHSTLLFDSFSVRLDGELDVIEEYRRFSKYMARQANQRVADQINEQLNEGLDDKMYIRLERMTNTIQGLFYRTRHTLTLPTANFSKLMSKWSFAFFILFKFTAYTLLVTGFGLAVTALMQVSGGDGALDIRQMFIQLSTNRLYHVVILLLIFVNGRSVLFRMDDKDV